MKEYVHPTNFRNYFSTFLFLETFALIASSPIVLAATWGILSHTLIGFLLVLGWTLIPCILIAVSHTRYVQRKNGFVVFANGIISYFEDEAELAVHSVNLSECRWYYGGVSQATLPFRERIFALQIGSPVLLIEFPDSLRLPKRRVHKNWVREQPIIVPVGQSTETRREWERILMDTDCVYDREREKIYSPFSFGTEIIVTLVIFPLCVLGGIFAAIKCEPLLNILGVPPDISKAIAFSLFAPGCVFLPSWVCILFFSSSYDEKITVASILQFWLGMLSITVLPVWLNFLDWTLNAKIAYTISVIAMCSLTTWIILKNGRNSLSASPH